MSLERHLDEDVLERYAMNCLPETEAEAVEDHTSLCFHCMNRLDEASALIQVMRTGLQAPVKEPLISRFFEWLRTGPPIWTLEGIGAAMLLFLAAKSAPIPAMATVIVSGTRGASTIVHGTGPFDFQLFMPETAAIYHVELLNQAGSRSWEGNVTGENGTLHAVVNRRVPMGHYFLRVTEPRANAVHDFGVNLER